MIAVEKSFTFSASHQLNNLPPSHPCHNLHGHNYEVTIRFYCDDIDDDTGFAVVGNVPIDYRTISRTYKSLIHSNFDHAHLNNFFDIPTAEIIAMDIHKRILSASPFQTIPPANLEIGVSETPKTKAWYYPDSGG